jgi:hypothetical protein
MRIYLSGKMTGLKDNGFPLFNEWAEKLRAKGHQVLNPAENDAGKVLRSRTDYLKTDLLHLVGGCVDAVAVLPNWRNSRGAKLEVLVASEVGIPILHVETLKPCDCVGEIEYECYATA